MTTDRGHVTRVSIQLRHRDVDTLGHLNQSVYHVFLEEVRAEILISLLGKEDVGYVLARVELDHRHEIRRTDGPVAAEAWIEHVGTKSVRVGTRIVMGDDDQVAAEGRTVLVAWDREARGARVIDDAERAVLIAAMSGSRA